MADGLLSVNDVVPTANATEQAQILAALSSTPYPVAADRPLTTTRGDARALHQVEVSRGGAFVPISGVLWFATKTAADTWGQSNPALLAVGDRCVAANMDYRWNGAAWKGVLPVAGDFVGNTSAGGTATVAHSLGAVPTSVIATDRNTGAIPGQRKVVKVVASDQQIQFAVYNTTNGTLLASNPVEFEWVAFP